MTMLLPFLLFFGTIVIVMKVLLVLVAVDEGSLNVIANVVDCVLYCIWDQRSLILRSSDLIPPCLISCYCLMNARLLEANFPCIIAFGGSI